MDDVAIKVEHVSKKYSKSLKKSMLYGVTDIGRNTLGLSSHSEKLRNDEFWAIDNISFEVKKGETLGIIGSNGSGKTTLLKMLNGIFWPDKGKITIKGKVGALIAVGAGFHPLLTGRENIYVNGAIMGMSKKEINDRFDEIVEFADIGDFLDSPVRNYSSGMFVRLGFACAINMEPDILLIDEVLSVGDLSFQNKSLRRLAEIREKANAVVFVSHNLEHVRNLCDNILILDKGKPVYLGKPNPAIHKYQELSHIKEASSLKKVEGFGRYVHDSSGDFIFKKGGLLDEFGNQIDEILFGKDIVVFYEFQATRNIENVILAASIVNNKGIGCIWQMSNDEDMTKYYNLCKGSYRLIIKFKSSNLEPGVYSPSISIRSAFTGEIYEKIIGYIKPFIIKGNIISRGAIIHPDSEWELNKIVQ